MNDLPLDYESMTGTSSSLKLLETKDIQEKLVKIKILILDVDGIMTDGRLFWQDEQGWTRHFHIHDGYGLKLMQKAGFEIGVLSGGDSKDVRKRMEFLKISHCFLGDEDKTIGLEKIKLATGFTYEQMAFMGDDLFDIPVIERVGFSATVPGAVDEVKAKVHYITEKQAGWGAVREVSDAIRKAALSR